IELQVTVLPRSQCEAREVAAVRVFDFAASFAVFRRKQVAEDGEEPRQHVRPRLEQMDVVYGAQERPLHEVIGTVDIAAERYCERAQARDGSEHDVTFGRLKDRFFDLLASSVDRVLRTVGAFEGERFLLIMLRW